MTSDRQDDNWSEVLGVAEAKRRFSELIGRIGEGEHFVVARRGRPVLALVPPTVEAARKPNSPRGLAAVAGALADWEDLDDVVGEIYAHRRRARDRAVPELE
jgi:antitoxin (DNA-binding transcriptional repressor) of toxin-antitoxin stability system